MKQNESNNRTLMTALHKNHNIYCIPC